MLKIIPKCPAILPNDVIDINDLTYYQYDATIGRNIEENTYDFN